MKFITKQSKISSISKHSKLKQKFRSSNLCIHFIHWQLVMHSFTHYSFTKVFFCLRVLKNIHSFIQKYFPNILNLSQILDKLMFENVSIYFRACFLSCYTLVDFSDYLRYIRVIFFRFKEKNLLSCF